MTFIKNVKLTYFNARGKGELIRYLLHYHEVPFDDNRIQLSNWQNIKSTMPLCQVPVFEFTDDDGKHHVMCQSGTIVRSLSRWYGLSGKTPEETAKADEIFECIRDVLDHSAQMTWESDMEKKEQKLSHLIHEVIPHIYGYIEKTLKAHSKKCVAGGDSFTYADFAVAISMDNMCKDIVIIPNVVFRLKLSTIEELEAKYPAMVALKRSVEEVPNIAKYLATRPETSF